MNSKNKYLIEVIGIMAVVASLIFVGMQLLLDRRIAMADQYFNRAEATRANLRARLESEAFFNNQEQMWSLGQRPNWWDENSELATLVREDKLSIRSLYYQIIDARIAYLGFDSNYYQYQQGLLSEEAWNGNLIAIRATVQRSELQRDVFLAQGRLLREVIEEAISELDL